MSILSAYYSGDLRAARAAHDAHVAHGDLPRQRAATVRRTTARDLADYPEYDGDLEPLLQTLRPR